MAIKQVIILPDVHLDESVPVPYKAAKKLIENIKPNEIVLLGDFADISSLSAWDYNKKRLMEGRRYKKEMIVLNRELDFLQKHSKKITYLEGNHEFRIKRYIDLNPEMEGLIELPEQLSLEKRGIKFIAMNKLYSIGKCNFTHGMYTNKYHASKHLQSLGCSIVYGHCFDEETEVLTQRGWIKGFDLLAADTVGTMNKSTRNFEWNKINKFFEYDNYSELVRIQSPTIDLLVTDKHGLVMLDHKDRIKLISANKLIGSKRNNWAIPNVAENGNWGYNSSLARKGMYCNKRMQRLLIQIVTDGSLENSSLVRFHLKKKRKIIRLKNLLHEMDISFREYKQKSGTTKISFNMGLTKFFPDRKKILGSWVLGFDATTVLREYEFTDGSRNGRSVQISSAKESEIELLQQLLTTNGYRATKNQRDSVWTLTVNDRKKSIIDPTRVSMEEYDGKVWCVNVDNGTLLVRRNGKVCVTQNSHRAQSDMMCMKMQDPVMAYGLGCLCDKQPDYLQGRPSNWINQFAIFEYDNQNGDFNIYPVNIINGQFRWKGKTYGTRKR